MTGQISNSLFAKYLSVLVSGTIIAHLITAGTLPFLTRIYSPEDFEILAVFNAITSLIAVVACLRYEIAVPFAEKTEDAKALVALSIGVTMVTSICLLMLLIATPSRWVNNALGGSFIGGQFWLIPLAVFSLALFSIVQAWFTRLQKFKVIASARVLQASSASGTQLLLGLAGWGPVGLILGYLANSLMGALSMGVLMLRAKVTKGVNISQITRVASSNIKFPKYSTWEALFNSGSIQLPILLIAAVGIGPEAGYLAISMYALQVPMALIGTSVGQIYYSEGGKAYRDGLLAEFNILMLSRLSTIGVGPLIFAGIVSPSIFSWIFGSEWVRAGELVRFMTPWFILQFMASPLSLAFTITGNQKLGSTLQAVGLFVRVGSVVFAALLFPEYIVEIFALSGAVFYGGYLVAVFRHTPSRLDSVLKALLGNLWVATIWLAFGVMVLLCVPYFENVLVL